MKKLFFVLSIIILLSITYLIIMNVDSVFAINYLKTQSGEYTSQSMSGALYTFGILLSGIFVGSGVLSLFLSVQKDRVNAYKRELEKTSISGASNASKVEVLEAKIKTLEKAFNTVVDERTQLEIQIKDLNTEIDNLNKG